MGTGGGELGRGRRPPSRGCRARPAAAPAASAARGPGCAAVGPEGAAHRMMVVGCRLRSRNGSAAASISPARMITLVVPSPTCVWSWQWWAGGGGQAAWARCSCARQRPLQRAGQRRRSLPHSGLGLARAAVQPASARASTRSAPPAAATPSAHPHLLVLRAAQLDDGLGGGVADVDLAQDGVAVVGQHDAAVCVQQHLQHGARAQRGPHNVGHRLGAARASGRARTRAAGRAWAAGRGAGAGGRRRAGPGAAGV